MSKLESLLGPTFRVSLERLAPLASTLDYALSKQPAWLHDIFGTRENGTAEARYLFQRTNPERKRPGPVVVSVSGQAIPPKEVRIVLDGAPIETASELLMCWSALTGKGDQGSILEISSGDEGLREEPPSTVGWIETLKGAYYKEAYTLLRSTDIFTPQRFERLKRGAVTHPLFAELAGKSSERLSSLDEELGSGERLGVSLDLNALAKLKDGKAIQVAFSPAHIGTHLIFLYMRDELKVPIEISFGLAHTVELAKRLISGNVPISLDLCSFTVSTAASVLGAEQKIRYSPFMFMPGMSHGILAPSRFSGSDEEAIRRGEYLLMSEVPSTEAFIFGDLGQHKGQPSRDLMKVREAEPDEVALALGSGARDLRAIIGFPYYVINHEFNDCRLLEPPRGVNLVRETLLFASNDFVNVGGRSHPLKVLVRDVWLRLREDPVTIQRLVKRLLSDEGYVTCLSRCLGLTHMSKFKQSTSSGKESKKSGLVVGA